jgi:hypothetical protein
MPAGTRRTPESPVHSGFAASARPASPGLRLVLAKKAMAIKFLMSILLFHDLGERGFWAMKIPAIGP